MRLRQQESARRSVEAETVRLGLRTSYADYLKPRTDPVTGDPVWTLKFGDKK